jgi:hypothetical protein
LLRLRVTVATLLLGLLRGVLPIASERVIFTTLVVVPEHLIGFLDFFELLIRLDLFFGGLRVGVGMPLARKLAIRGFYVFFSRVFGDAEDVVVILVVQVDSSALY